MNSKDIRKAFLNFFRNKGHNIIPSSPMVIKNDPSLMFTNAGMNQFKDYFLGNSLPEIRRIADTQKCLRVTGKHNDLEQVGHDTYHHTMFEMLGNWSFGDYFKNEAIEWSWEFLTEIVKLDSDRLYATIFDGDIADKLEKDIESFTLWKQYLPEDHILQGSKKDNFWEMGTTGPCGPCSEIHIDLRNIEERKNIPGAKLVNQGHPLVIEIWNLVFIQFNRKADNSLDHLPEKHVDTGMGFERLCMALQGKKSSYDTDIFSPLLKKIGDLSGCKYGDHEEKNIAMRVIADHLRAVVFSIAEGQLPSNNKAGYVIRRILRRAIRYSYTNLGHAEPFIYKLVGTLVEIMGDPFEELKSQQELVEKVIYEEEQSFLNTLENGIRRLSQMQEEMSIKGVKVLPGKEAFELYDTFGFPVDLTELILKENDLTVDNDGFLKEMKIQKQRSKNDAATDKSDWTILIEDDKQEFTGYDYTSNEIKITRYRKVKSNENVYYELVFNLTPFYAESGGQVGDTGVIENQAEKIQILDTQKENDLSIHIAKELPKNLKSVFTARVNESERTQTASNHTATHLVHFALRKVLGNHVEQKGSLVNPEMFRFDFAHFQKVTEEEIRQVEQIVNSLIRQNIPLDEHRKVPFAEAKKMGAMSLFGEKYGDLVRVIRFGDSIELCGGIHASATGQLGFFTILKESSIAAGIRRIEAITGVKAEEYVHNELDKLNQISNLLEKNSNIVEAIKKLAAEHSELNREVNNFKKDALNASIISLKKKAEKIGNIHFISEIIPGADAEMLRDAAFRIKNEVNNLFLILGSKMNHKALLVIMISENLVSDAGLDASKIIREISKDIQGGGGGQAFFATAGGKNPDGLGTVLEKVRKIIQDI